MKCDKLKSYYYYEDRVITPATHTYRVYHADKVDAAIAELKQKLEDVQASMYADVVDANMENRRLRRALWLARENSAEGQFFYWGSRLDVESGFTKADILGYSVNTKQRLRTIGEWIETWKNIKRKCRAKAEEYK